MSFKGFPKGTLEFYRELSLNNDRTWFNAHRDNYEEQVLEPAQAFVSAMGERLKKLRAGIVVDTRTNGSGSIFRIHNDVRFSKDKTPYKTHLGIFFWEGLGKKMDSSGFYMHFEPPKLMLFAGMHEFSRETLLKYRIAVTGTKSGPALTKAVNAVTSKGTYAIGGSHYKKIPAGYDGSGPNADFLLYNGLFASVESSIPREFYGPGFIDYCFERFSDMNPIHDWLTKLLIATPGKE